jgi:hypothetical protein
MTGKWLARGAVVTITLIGVAVAYAYAGLAIRFPSDTASLRYVAEALEPESEHSPPAANTWSDPAPGSQYVGSPDGRYLALTREARRAYHTVFVWDERTQTLHPVVSIQEGDPGSGASHTYRWSADSGALFISGWGALPLRGAENPLSYVYVVREDKLYRVTSRG